MSSGTRPAKNISWRFGILAAVAMTLLSLVPQLHLWASRGRDWQGTYASFDFDEVAYASYLNALIDGRPRRNDPYSGRADPPGQDLSVANESLFSIQFLPAYVAALPARLFGLSAGTTLILIRALAAFATTLALFWLLLLITRDGRVAAAGTIIVLCLGGLAGEPHDAWRIITLRGAGESLPFLRRYVPALVFPFFFAFSALVWQALTTEKRDPRLIKSLLAGLTFALLIFSYFFLWTAIVAWLFLVALLWLSASSNRIASAQVFGIILAIGMAAFIPYALLLSRRAETIDSEQLLAHSRTIIWSLPVFIGVLALIAIAIAGWRLRLNWRDPQIIFTVSFALLPAVTFNQQLVTGLLLQPVHYGRYSANYTSLVALLLAIVLSARFRNSGSRQVVRVLAIVAIAVFAWAVIENSARAYRLGPLNSARDEAQRVAWRLRELSLGSKANLNTGDDVVFCSDLAQADALPNIAPQPILWSPHLTAFSGVSANESRERLYQQLYYSGVDEEQFGAIAASSSYLQLALFGWERMNQKPYAALITSDDVLLENARYAAYVRRFSKEQASSPLIEYVVVPASGGALNNLDRWYERDGGQRVGEYVIYRVRIR